ncbi:uncharacterized protein TNCV_3501321 [Trichonephila clavipes]|uniref:Uncharacterized protein n=1 Tax=Trichonephila clavipes TaxID=2585209 RepID=A0A8X6RW88_TRICX|nr:uncharacterized protein TNCV_3501321 [Trichonephila clavipes]
MSLKLHLKQNHDSTDAMPFTTKIISCTTTWNCGSPVVRVLDHGWRVTSSSPVPLKTRRVGKRCTLNLSRSQTSSRWCGVVVRRRGASSDVVLVT